MTILALNFKNTVPDTPQTVFTSPAGGNGTRIDSFTATNNGAVNSSYKAYIDNGVADDDPIIPMQIIVWGEIDLGVGIVNQTIPAGASLKVETSLAGVIGFTVSGVELS